MRLFSCQICSQMLFFENTRCERCLHPLGFWPATEVLSALTVAPDSARDGVGDTWVATGADGLIVRQCANARHDGCNWLVDAASGETMCAACRHNRIVPELSSPGNSLAWRKIEIAKHRLFYTLFKLRLAQTTDLAGGPKPLVFRFLADQQKGQAARVVTGHKGGVITIALSEADDAERERRRKALGEPYRTLLGHFRHEIGHFFWDRLVREGGRLDACRAVFGDDRRNYREALKRHYADGPPVDWQRHCVSSYATSHPWEDFAETWAHYLHILDTLEMARAYDLTLAPSVDKVGAFDVDYRLDPYAAIDIGGLVKVWLPVSTALNSMSKSMGKDDLYPFVLAPPVIAKLGFVHRLIQESVGRSQDPSLKGSSAISAA